MSKPDYVYVASSWRCPMQPIVVQAVRAAGIKCYDFRDSDGFHWSEVMDTDWRSGVPVVEYLEAIEHPRSIQGFDRDFEAMQRADAFVLVMPCGRSAHLELGWAIGQGKRTAILLEEVLEPDLMWKMADFRTASTTELLGWLGVDD